MKSTLSTWHADHVNFGRLLDCLEGQLELFHDGGSPHYELMLDIMYYMTHYSDALHHPKEDLAFARIKAREPQANALVEALDEQHEELRRMGSELVVRLSDVFNGAVTTRTTRVIASIAVAMFVAELGDKTMLATATLAAQGNPVLVWFGATIGIMLAGTVGVVIGRLLGDRLPERVILIGSSLLFLVFGIVLIVSGVVGAT